MRFLLTSFLLLGSTAAGTPASPALAQAGSERLISCEIDYDANPGETSNQRCGNWDLALKVEKERSTSASLLLQGTAEKTEISVGCSNFGGFVSWSMSISGEGFEKVPDAQAYIRVRLADGRVREVAFMDSIMPTRVSIKIGSVSPMRRAIAGIDQTMLVEFSPKWDRENGRAWELVGSFEPQGGAEAFKVAEEFCATPRH